MERCGYYLTPRDCKRLTVNGQVCLYEKSQRLSSGQRLVCNDCRDYLAGDELGPRMLANDMNPGELVPIELQGLTVVEQMLIARARPFITFHRLRHSSMATSGHSVTCYQDVQEIYDQSPQLLESLKEDLVVMFASLVLTTRMTSIRNI